MEADQTMPENPYAVDALLKTILDAGITFEDMQAADDGHWAQISALAEVNIPGDPRGRTGAIEGGSMNPILFALFMAGAVALAAEDVTRFRRAAQIKRRILDGESSDLLWSKVKR
jgi:hypothetical protein